MAASNSNEVRLRIADELAAEFAALISRAKDANLELTAVSLEFSLSMLHRERYKIKITH